VHLPVTIPIISGKRSKNTSTLGAGTNDSRVIAVCWLLEGGKTTKREMVQSIAEDLSIVETALQQLKVFSRSARHKLNQTRERGARQGEKAKVGKLDLLDQDLDRIKRCIAGMKKKHEQLSREPEQNDEVIDRVHFPSPINDKEDTPWFHFDMTLEQGIWLSVKANRSKVLETPTWAGNVGSVPIVYDGRRAVLLVVPLDPIPPSEQKKEVKINDGVVLLGGLAIVRNGKGKVVNFLKITALDVEAEAEEDSYRSEDDSGDESEKPTTRLN
jgi:hypothetical protein